MKPLRHIALTALLTIGAFSAITYTSCTKDACADISCENGGTCSGGICTCPTGYEGVNCETLTRDKYVGKWTGTDICTSGTYTYDIELDPSSANAVQILITNPGAYGNNITITGTIINSNQIAINNANVGGNNRMLSGTMTFNTDNSMSFVYTVTTATENDQCSGSFSKQ